MDIILFSSDNFCSVYFQHKSLVKNASGLPRLAHPADNRLFSLKGVLGVVKTKI